MDKHADTLNLTFAALADPTRRAILARLAQGEATVSELAQPFSLSQPAISKHLKVLERAGLVARGRAAQTRPCRLAIEPLQQASDWMVGCRGAWEARLDRLDVLLQKRAAAATPAGKPPTSKPRRRNSP